jgi:single-strand DNA-binding protein
MFNETTLVGRITRDAEVGEVPNVHHTPRLRFTLAVDREHAVDGQTSADFWPVELVGEHGLRLAPHLTRGRLLLVNGPTHIDERRDTEGRRHVFPYLTVRHIRFLDHKPGSVSETNSAAAAEQG